MQTRIYSLDFLKVLATIFITNSHFIPLYEDVSPSLATFGVHGNALFFFVSGYLLMMGLEKKHESFDNWFKKRIQRLWPAVFIWAIIASMLYCDELSWQKILLAPKYWFLQAIVIYFFIFYFVGNWMARLKRGGVFDGCRTVCFSDIRFYFTTRKRFYISHTMALFMSFQHNVNGGIGVFKQRQD